MSAKRQKSSSSPLVYSQSAYKMPGPGTGNSQALPMLGKDPVTWAIAAASLGLHEQEAGVRSLSWESNPGPLMDVS